MSIRYLFFSLQTVTKYYSEEEAELSLHMPFLFEGDKVTLDIPNTETKLPNGWSIVPMAHPASVSLTTMLYFVYTIENASAVCIHLSMRKVQKIAFN